MMLDEKIDILKSLIKEYTVNDNSVLEFVKKLLPEVDTSFTQTRLHMLDIYETRLRFSKEFSGEHNDGLEETVSNLASGNQSNVKVSSIDGESKSCVVFTDEDVKIIIGVIFYPLSYRNQH